MSDSVKQFALRITTSKVSERRRIIQDVVPCVESKDVPDTMVRAVLKVLRYTLSRYHDRQSRNAVEHLIWVMACHHPEATLTQFNIVVGEVAELQKKILASTMNAGICLNALAWSSGVVRASLKKHVKMEGNLFNKMVEIQSLLLMGIMSVEKKTIINGAYNRMKRIWKEVPDSVGSYATAITNIEGHVSLLCMISCLYKYLTSIKQKDTIAKHKAAFVDIYLKQVIQCRVSLPVILMDNSRDFLRHITHDEFKSAILPAIVKGMLRNPEVSLQVMCSLISGVTLDLSVYAVDIAKHLATHLHNKDETPRLVAIQGCKQLAKQCSDVDAVEKVIGNMFAVLNGSEGKLTVVSQRMGVMSGIGAMSQATITGAATVQSLAASTAAKFIQVLKLEVHEGTLVHALQNFTLWCKKFSTEVPKEVTEWFKTGYALKSSTPVVRNSYILAMNAAYRGDTLIEGLSVLPLLLKTVEKGAGQASNLLLVTEALSASCLLARLASSHVQADDQLNAFWKIIQDHDKQLFVNDKFLQSATSSQTLMSVCDLVQHLILEHSQRLSERMLERYCYAFVYAACCGNYEQRKHAQSVARKLTSILGGANIALMLIKQFGQFLASHKVFHYQADSGDSGYNSTSTETATSSGSSSSSALVHPTSRVLADVLCILADVPKTDAREGASIALSALLHAHHHAIVQYNSSCWTDIVAKLKIDAKQFIEQNVDKILDTIYAEAEGVNQTVGNVIKTLVWIAPESVIPKIIDRSLEKLSDSRLTAVTTEEYNVMNWPAGEVYDRTAIDKAAENENASKMNLKRENKAYSYKEQMAELELKQELERKRKERGETEPKLSKKQQELMKEQLQKEEAIRSKVKEVDVLLRNACYTLEACIAGNAVSMRLHIPDIVNQLVQLMSYPLTAPRVVCVFVKLVEAAFCHQDYTTALPVAYLTLRLLEPKCALDSAWTEEALPSMISRTLSLLHNNIVHKQEVYTATTYCYLIPMLSALLKQHSMWADKGLHNSLLQALKIMNCAGNLRSKATGDEPVDEYGPDLLPRYEMFKLLTHVIATSSAKIQQNACEVLQCIAECASGKPGCAAAEQDEIDVLLHTTYSPSVIVREVALKALLALSFVLPTPDTEEGISVLKTVTVWRYDNDDNNSKLAESIMEEAGMEMQEELCDALVSDCTHHEECVRDAATKALAAALQQHTDHITDVIDQLLVIYEDKLYTPPPVLDGFGRIISESPPDQWQPRTGVAMAIERICGGFDEDHVENVFKFFVEKGLGDRNNEVRKKMLEAARQVVELHGKNNVGKLLPVFEKFLKEAPNSAEYDAVRQSIVILMGSLAKHLDKDDPRVKPIVKKLIEMLSTPSQEVQEAVSQCLPPLVPAIKDEAPQLVQNLLKKLRESGNYGECKGAAYGLAGLVKGLGILSLKQLEIMKTLQDAIQNKKNPRYREGALFAFEMLCLMLGRLFEPYVVHILPHLLLCFGDTNGFVRQAADDTAKAVMSKLSAHGVKLVLPSLLTGLEEDSWRTKTGSVDLLGAMAFCAPKQLSACLPSIVPKLIDVLTDSHLKVQKAAAQALKQIGSVIRNPEIQAIVPELLAALQEPSLKTTTALQVLLDTKFVHFIDAPSLALIMPVVTRAFSDRSTETRKMAAQIIGSMYSLTDQKDLSPYLPAMIPGLKQSLLDPVPEVRHVSARALGAMVRGMGESGIEELLPWLMETLVTPDSSVDRSGAAQGLSEVAGALGLEKLRKLMTDIITTTERTDIAPHVRDGYMMMYIYLPMVFQEDFKPYIGPIIPSILQGLSDEAEFVRDTALRAGARVVNLYAETAVELLLPELERGLVDENWRIRYSSVKLMGDLLYKISGVTGKQSTESAHEDDNFGTDSAQEAILAMLGEERRNRVLAGLYIGRSDTAPMVRQAALHVWKITVTHTPKMLREILSTLFNILLSLLASESFDKRKVAARTLGDLVKKLGEKILPEIIPILEESLDSERADQRQGVCIGLTEIMASTSRDHVLVYADSLIPTVRRALCDPLPEVRESAAETFDNLHSTIGSRALDDILPNLLRKLNDTETADAALDGLTQMMSVKGRVVMPYLIPQLTAKPVNMHALSLLASHAGDALTKHLSKILAAMMSSYSDSMGTDEEATELEYCQVVVLSVHDETGMHTVIEELLTTSGHTDVGLRRAAICILQVFCEQTKLSYADYVPQLLRGVIHLYIDEDQKVLEAAWSCLNAITKRMDANDMQSHISDMRQAIRYAVADCKTPLLPGFCLPKKGIAPLLPLYREGILNGAPEMKESASIGLGEVIKRTSADALKPSVVHITGPLIRVLGDRFSHTVKVAVIETLGLLLSKCGAMLKPFLPQLQTTFLKALNDPVRSVRLRAASALSKLVTIHIRMDQLFTDLHAGLKGTDDVSIRETFLQALRGCITSAGSKMTAAMSRQLLGTLETLLGAPEDTIRTTAGACVGAMCAGLDANQLTPLLNQQLLDCDDSLDWTLRHGRVVALFVALKEAPHVLVTDQYTDKITKVLQTYIASDRAALCLGGIRGGGYLLRYQRAQQQPLEHKILNAIIQCMKLDSNDIKQVAALSLCFVAEGDDSLMDKTSLKLLLTCLVFAVREKNTIVRTNSELAMVAILRLRSGEQDIEAGMSTLTGQTKDALNDILIKLKRKVATLPAGPSSDDIDTSILR